MNDSSSTQAESTGSVFHQGGVALLSPCGWGNLGDAAILESVIHAVRRRLPGAPILGLTLNPPDTAWRHGIPAHSCTGFSYRDYGVSRVLWASPEEGGEPFAMPSPSNGAGGPKRLRDRLRAFARTLPVVHKSWDLARAMAGDVRHRLRTADATAHLDYVVVAGGGQLDDFWGGTLGHPYVLWRWSQRARMTGARFLVLSVGTGNLSTPLSRRFVRQALAEASYRSFRDEGSRRLVDDPAVAGDPVVPDLAYALPLAGLQPPSVSRGDRPLVGVSALAYCDPRVGPIRDAARYRFYLRRLGTVAAHLLETGNDLLLFGTDGPDAASNQDLLGEIAQRVPAPLLERIQVPVVTGLSQLFAALAPVDVVLASRLHGVILAHLAGIPVAAISYERKVAALMKIMGQEDYAVTIDDFQPGDAWRRVEQLLARRAEVASDIAAKVARFRVQVEEQYDRVFTPRPGAG